VQKLYKFLDLDVKQSYDILCYYLVNEYRGSASSLQNFVSNESLMIKLLNDIWFYYSLERMVQLKVVKCLLEYHESNNHPYRGAFKEIVAKIGMEKLRKSFIDQFESLLKDTQSTTKYITGDITNSPQKLQIWSERKCRELNEMLQIILLTFHFDTPKPDEILKLVELFKLHAFGKQNQFLNTSSSLHLDLIQKINYSEIAVLMIALSKCSDGNVPWMNEVIEKVGKKIEAMDQYQEHGPLLLSWMIFKFSSKKNENTLEQCGKYGRLGSKAVQLNVFDFLLKLIKHKQFSDKSLLSKVVIRCVYDNLSFLCELFNADGSMGQYAKIYELFAEILKMPMIAKEFCKSESLPIRTLFDSAVQSFPHDFIPLSIIAKSLSQASIQSNAWIMQFLQNLPIFAEQPNDPLYELRKSNDSEDDTYILLNSYQPFQRINDYVIPVGTNAIVRQEKGKMFVYFMKKLNYFHALHNEINGMLNSIVNFTEIQESKIDRLEAGISLLAALIKRIDNPNEITNEMIVPTEMVYDILEKFKAFQHPPLRVMAACLNVFAELSPYFGNEIYRRFTNLNIAPSVNQTHRDFRAYSNGSGFELGLVGFYLINIECSSGKYDFLKSYLTFLKKMSKVRI
jgi:nuclear pore complex protein Nup188